MASDGRVGPAIRSLAWATDIDVLPADRVVERRDGYWAIRSPSNPTHYWGNFLLFDAAPAEGDGTSWEESFVREIGGASPGHVALAWDETDGELGAARAEFVTRGYELQPTVGLIARPGELAAHPRESRDVVVRALNPSPGADEGLWEEVVEMQVAGRDRSFEDADAYRAFSRARLTDLRKLFRAGRGAWFVALAGDERGGSQGGKVVASLGLVVTGGRGRYQAVDTVAEYRGRGICSRLVVEAARRTVAEHPVEHLVICADPGYHALGIYESLGFRRAESVNGLLRRPKADRRG